jgi:hypothetical protein
MPFNPVIAPQIHPVLHGIPGPPGKNALAGHLEITFDFSDLITALDVGLVPVGAKIFKVQFDVVTPFDNDCSFSVGTDATPTGVFTLSGADSAVVENYHQTLNLTELSLIKLFPYYITQPTTGQAVTTTYYN